MKKQLDIKKLLLLNMPYILMGLFATNFGEGWRMAVGADASAKMLSFFSTLPVALVSWWPSFHPLDLLVGLCCGAGLRLAVYLKSKNAKKYRHGMEYGSARWGTHEDIAPYGQMGLSEPRFAACQSQGIPWFQSHGQWGGRDYANIAPGDAIFFDWDLDGSADHVGLVVGTDGSRVYTVEGNSGDACKIKSYSLTYECIKGYGLMNW